MPTSCIRLRDLHFFTFLQFTTRIIAFDSDIKFDKANISPKSFGAILEDFMRRLERYIMGGKLIPVTTPSSCRGWHCHPKSNYHPSITELADFDDQCGKIGLQLNLLKTMFMKNG